MGQVCGRFIPAVVIVDNASNNGTAERLRDEYASNSRVVLLENGENLGFSRANNRGFILANEVFSPRHIVVLNNDTAIEQANFLERIEELYEQEGEPFVIGPDIYVRRKGRHQSPMRLNLRTRDEVQRSLDRLRSEPFDWSPAVWAKAALRDMLARTADGRGILQKRGRVKQAAQDWNRPARNCVLHGAAMVFTRAFLETGEKPFVPETFLYEEEQILAVRCRKNKWDCLYTPELQVIHFDDGSTDLLTGNATAKDRFVKRHEIESHKVLLNYMDSCGH